MAEWVRAFDWRPGGPGFESRCGNLFRFGISAIPFTPLCQCLSEETLKAVGPFYLVSMPGEVKDPTSLHWKCVTCRGLHHPLLDPTPLTYCPVKGPANELHHKTRSQYVIS